MPNTSTDTDTSGDTSGRDAARYERKYLITGQRAGEVAALLRRHPAFFHEVYHQRAINTLYFDTPDLHDYYDNVIGISQRSKVRVRWYREQICSAGDAQLELKAKQGFRIKKTVQPLESFALSPSGEIIREHETLAPLQLRSPVIANRYQRRYFMTRDATVRATIDSEVSFFPVRRRGAQHYIQWQQREILPGTILELKYGVPHDDDIDDITRHLPFDLTKSSKYVFGMQAWHAHLR